MNKKLFENLARIIPVILVAGILIIVGAEVFRAVLGSVNAAEIVGPTTSIFYSILPFFVGAFVIIWMVRTFYEVPGTPNIKGKIKLRVWFAKALGFEILRGKDCVLVIIRFFKAYNIRKLYEKELKLINEEMLKTTDIEKVNTFKQKFVAQEVAKQI